MKTEEEAVESFRVALQDLTFNSKPIITGLTVKAREMSVYAPSIVKVIKEHLSTAALGMKLPCLYLIDSIVKNLGEPFVELFAEGIADTFCAAYTSLVDEKMRKEFLRVYGLWAGVFPEIPLRDIEQRLRLRRSTKNGGTSDSSNVKRPSSQYVSPYPPPPPPPQPVPYQHYSPSPHPHPVPSPSHYYYPPYSHHHQHQAYPPYYPPPVGPPPYIHQHSHFSDYPAPETIDHHLAMSPAPRVSPAVMGMLIQLRTFLLAPSHAIPQNAVSDIVYRLGALAELDPNTLRDLDARCRLSDTSSALALLEGIIDPGHHYRHHQHHLRQQQQFKPADADAGDPGKKHVSEQRQPLHHALYEALPKQCRMCGIRFSDDQDGKDAYAVHLDAHFRRNRRLKDRAKRVLARDWLPKAADWMAGRMSGQSERAVPVFFGDAVPKAAPTKTTDQGDTAGAKQQKDTGPVNMIKAGESDRDRTCAMCNEPLEIVFDQDLDEWMFRNAVEEGGDIYHATCLLPNLSKKEQRHDGEPSDGIVHENAPKRQRL